MSVDITRPSVDQLKNKLRSARSGLLLSANVLAHLESAVDEMPPAARDAVFQLASGASLHELVFMCGTIPDPGIMRRCFQHLCQE